MLPSGSLWLCMWVMVYHPLYCKIAVSANLIVRYCHANPKYRISILCKKAANTFWLWRVMRCDEELHMSSINPYTTLKYFLHKRWRPTGLFQYEIIITSLSLLFFLHFEYLCYRYTLWIFYCFSAGKEMHVWTSRFVFFCSQIKQIWSGNIYIDPQL